MTLHRQWAILGVTLTVLAGIALGVYRLAPAHAGLVVFCGLMFVSNTCIPLIPHEPIVMYYGKLYNPMLIATLGGISTIMIEWMNYQVLVYLANLPSMVSMRKTRWGQGLIAWFQRYPYLVLLIAGLSPIPFYPFRVLSAASTLPLPRYLSAIFISRLTRYYLLARLGGYHRLPTSWITGIFIVLLLINFIQMLGRSIRRWAVEAE